MDRSRLQELLTLLKQDEYRTAQQLAKHMRVSEKTVRIAIRDLNAELMRSGAGIESKPRYGYRLVVTDQEQFANYQSEEEKSGMIPDSGKERSEYLMAYLLFRKNYVKIEELCDFMYLSKTTLSHYLKNIENVLDRYRLSIERRPNYGIKIVGEEFDIRRLISDYYIKHHCLVGVNLTHQEQEIARLAETVKRLLAKYDVHLSEMSFDNFVDYTYVACKRMKAGYYLKLNKENLPEIGIKEEAFSRELLNELENSMGITYTQDEKNYLLLYLAGKRMIGNVLENDSNFIIQEQTDRLAMEMLKLISNDYHMNFQNNFEMRMTLNQHLVPFDVRMRYDIPLKNPLLKDIKEKYSLAFQMAVVASGILVNHYKKEISEDEIGYFALIFQLALEKEQSDGYSNILVVCSTGKATSRLLKYKYEQEFSEYLDNIYVCDLMGLETFDMSKVDYIFTTVPITKKVDVPIVEVGMFLEDDDIRKVTDALRYGRKDDILRRYYTPDRFLTDVPKGDKEAIIKYICQIISEQETVDDDFYDMVLERETYVQMDYGNHIALPHPNRIASEESFAYVAVLKQPVIWNEFPVQVVILISIGRQGGSDKDRQKFYEATARFALDKEAVMELIGNPSYETLMELLS